MATTKIQKEMTGTVQRFIQLWNRYYTLYLENVQRQDITAEKENEFLRFQGTMVEQIVQILELDDKSRFDINDKVMSVINEVVSLDSYTKMSEFQINRTKRQWQEAMEELEKLYRFCDIYDQKIDKVQKITEDKKKNPYWDPTAGGIRDVLSRIAVAPVTFFQGMKAGSLLGKMGSFLFLTFLIPVLTIMTIVFLLNFSTVKIIGQNVVIEAGLLSSDETGFIPSLIIAAAVLAGLFIITMALCVVFIILHHIMSWFLHLGFKMTGAKETYTETFKAVTYGAAPIVAAITAPYAIVLQIIGASKVHKYPYLLATIGWIIGTVLFLSLIFIALGATFYMTGIVPPFGAKYAYVTSEEANLYDFEGGKSSSVIRGAYISLSDSKEAKEEKISIGKAKNQPKTPVYKVKYMDKSYYIEKDDIEIIDFSMTKMPRFIIDKSIYCVDATRAFINKVIKKYSE
jgi:hypothetical protein